MNTTATEPVAWDPKGTLDPDTSIAALRAMGFAVATTGLDPVASALIGVATAEPGPDDPDGAALWTMPDIGIRTRGGVTTWAVPIHPDRPVDPADPRVRAALRRSGLTVDALRDGYPWDTMRRHVEDELHRDGTPCPAVAEYGKITVTHHAGFHIAVLAARGIVPPPTVDTMLVAKLLDWPMRLDQAAYRARVPLADRGPETAGADPVTPLRLWRAMIPHLEGRGIRTWGRPPRRTRPPTGRGTGMAGPRARRVAGRGAPEGRVTAATVPWTPR